MLSFDSTRREKNVAESVINSVPQRQSIEQKLVEIWAESLELNEIDLRKNFVDLGGESLAATLCMSRIRKLWKVDFSIEDFFTEDATIPRFAELIQRSEQEIA